ncbi:MAG: imidazole glycerol phosphate synthase, glutamine amidotransferase subunit [Bacteroidetes bacterium GWE2_29_8]|nr:MAG: imidazole glycerol phosphate synthase, glutamine amidotransferase subunit [Bacteroidetes bacterium GWE2_29_8]OFY24686.1 MAG: imidazole glycerol phosphate synthase, glutamine amidotransferase subunit [Bacteroidetes bacterium GWF2_29_10]
MVVIIDYGLGNLNSLGNSINKAGGFEYVITNDLNTIKNADKLILAGVGAFGKAMDNIKNLNLLDTLNKKVLVDKTPIIGICLGMQLLSSFSEEGNCDGLNWIKGNTIKFVFDSDTYRIPNVGWNTVIKEKQNKLFTNISDESTFYFTHSYHFEPQNKENILGSTQYGIKFASIVNHENIYGVQFHPEKSHKQGLELLSNFIKYI